jgi:arylformamidase
MRDSDFKIYDISPEVSSLTKVFPGDVPFQRKVQLDFERGDALLLSSIQTTLHIGAHTDAPNHYHPEGKGISECDLSRYLGRCQVISVHVPRGDRIPPESLSSVKIEAPRVLLKTGSFPDPEHWNSDFNSLSPALVRDLASKGVKLIGIDTPSVDPESAKELIAHHEIYRQGLSILEGIILSQVPDGIYTLIALPLRIQDADASPVRAVLLPDFAMDGLRGGSKGQEEL